ncbi:MAG: hypothetical protein GY953_09100 [bacterium]|nr:hypothetical protein [bacterium]
MANMLTGTLQGNVITLDIVRPLRQERGKRRVQVTIEPLEDAGSELSGGPLEGDDATLSRQRNARIDALYAEIRGLMSSGQAEPAAREVVRDRVEELRKLQQLEAEAMHRRFESRLSFPSGTGLKALENARRLLADDADPAATHGSAAAAD